jgi:hypothetical protein
MRRRILGLLVVILSIITLYLAETIPMPLEYSELFVIISGYFLTLLVPGLVIDLVFGRLEKGFQEGIASKCGGLQHGGVLIGGVERSLIFLALMITYYDNALSYTTTLSFLSIIVAAKAIFRYSSGVTGNRECADWYILGTLMSITLALALTWGIFRFLLTG